MKSKEIARIIIKNGDEIIVTKNQFFEEYPDKIELWEEYEKGFITKIKGWYKKSILFIITKKEIEELQNKELEEI